MKVEITESEEQPLVQNPREALAQWANKSAEWTRRIVRHILTSAGPVSPADQAVIYRVLLEENDIGPRSLQAEPQIVSSAQAPNQQDPFLLTHMDHVKGVNALVEDSKIDFGPGLTLLFGENGTGKTGYARILKCLAGSRSADDILPDINLDGTPPPPSAEIGYRLGATGTSYQWKGESAQSPFTLMSVFDSPSVSLHIDSDLSYTYRPASLSVFDRVTVEVQKIQTSIEKELQDLKPSSSTFLSQFSPLSSVYSLVQSIGAATNLAELQEKFAVPVDSADQENNLNVEIARLVANAVGQEIGFQEKVQKVVTEAGKYGAMVLDLKIGEYNSASAKLLELQNDQGMLRHTLFAAADLPAEPEQTWESFVRAGKDYLENLGVHDDTRCLYCRQLLSDDAAQLISKYGDYLEGKIAKEIEAKQTEIARLIQPLLQSSLSEARSYLEEAEKEEFRGPQVSVERVEVLKKVIGVDNALRQQLSDSLTLDENSSKVVSDLSQGIELWISEVSASLQELARQNSDRDGSLQEKRKELVELQDRIKAKEVWAEITEFVTLCRRTEKLMAQKTDTSNVLRRITALSNRASEQLVNNNFQSFFHAECVQLRVPELQLEFLGREGHAQRRKKLSGDNKPSKVLSEGEQRALAIADFIAEVRMSDQQVPVVFDDPVSSLDHRRLGEVAARIADLASDRQVVVFSHDIFFVCYLLAFFESSGSCVYFQVTDEDGKGTVTRGTGPRWDTVSGLTARVNESIQKAKSATGEEREHYVREGYSWIRSWCEVFVEREVLAQVTERYQPNVRMMALDRIKVSVFDETRKTVVSVFERACRYMEGHSQPLATLGVAPTLTGLETDWTSLKECKERHDKAPG